MRCRIGAIGVAVALLAGLAVPAGPDFPGSLVPAAFAAPTELTESYVYPYIDELRIREAGCPIFVTDRPYVRIDLARWLRDCPDSDTTADWRSRWLRGMLEEELSGETGLLDATETGWTLGAVLDSRAVTDRKAAGGAITRFAVYAPWGLSLWSTVRVTLNSPYEHKVGTRQWKERGRASLEQGGIGFRKEGFSLFLGRDEIAWGADRRRGLLFSGSAPSFDMVKLTFGTRRFRFISFHSRLRHSKEDDAWLRDSGGDDTEPGAVRRYVSAHRLEVAAGRWLTVSVSEAVIYGGYLRDFDPVYLNPMGIFYAGQWNSAMDDNILIGGDFTVLLPGRAEIRGELMVDDFQYDFGGEPHKFAVGLSAAGVNPLDPGRSMLGGSYYQVRAGTYDHHVIWDRFVQEGHVMGYPDGPDGDMVALWTSLALPAPVCWRLDYSYRRQGEGRVTDILLPESPHVKFPSGIVESEHRLGLGLTWRPSFAWMLRGAVVYSSTQNVGNRAGDSDSGFDFDIGLTFNLTMAGRFAQ